MLSSCRFDLLFKDNANHVTTIQAKRKQKQDLSPQELSAEDLQDLGNLVLGFLPKQIKEINATQFKDAVEIFGQTVGYDEEQLKALVDKTKEAYKYVLSVDC